MNDTVAVKFAHTEFKSEGKLAHVLCFWKMVTEVKCTNQVLNSNIYLSTLNILYFSLKIKMYFFSAGLCK